MKIKSDNIKFDFDDIFIVPSIKTDIKSRYNNVDPYVFCPFSNRHGMLPLFTAPMDTVVDFSNKHIFTRNKINVCLPRTVSLEEVYRYNYRGLFTFDDHFFSCGLEEFENIYLNDSFKGRKFHPQFVLIDVANGHMEDVVEISKRVKSKYMSAVTIMAGNIANPEAYRWYAESEAINYVRLGIGNGSGCLTTKKTGIGYPKASLIKESYEIKKEIIDKLHKDYLNKDKQLLNYKLHNLTKIVADGGMQDDADIVKALALGADFVMIGGIFNRFLESAAPTTLYGIKLNKRIATWAFRRGYPVKKLFYGMSTKIAQKKMGKRELKTSEGVIRIKPVEWEMHKWVENFEHFLRSNMSYCRAHNLVQFRENSESVLITENAYNRMNK